MISISKNNLSYKCDCHVIEKNNIVVFNDINIDKNAFYTIITLDKNNKTVTFIQDDLGDIKQYYYASINDEILIDTSIKNIINKMETRQFNDQSLYYFLSCGFIPNENTLVKNINKVVPGYVNIYNIDNNTIILNNIKLDNCNEKFCEHKYKNILLNNMNKYVKKDMNVGFAISSGFDSNLLISLYNRNVKNNNSYFCIGGNSGVNEIPEVKKILKNYNYSDFNYGFVDKNTFNNYHKIVYMYEGLFYERGIFLQYQLYELLKYKNINIILGEGADQVLHINSVLNNDIKCNIKKKGYSLYKNCPKEILNYLVLKKSSLLLSYTKNNIIYPYLYKNFRNYNYSFNNLYGYDKNKHKKLVKNEVEINISKILNKTGGATDQESLFSSREELNDIKDIALTSHFSNIVCEHNTTELSLDIDYILKIIYLLIFEKIFMIDNKYIDNSDLLENVNIQEFIIDRLSINK